VIRFGVELDQLGRSFQQETSGQECEDALMSFPHYLVSDYCRHCAELVDLARDLWVGAKDSGQPSSRMGLVDHVVVLWSCDDLCVDHDSDFQW
jgi:hypothetical protein